MVDERWYIWRLLLLEETLSPTQDRRYVESVRTIGCVWSHVHLGCSRLRKTQRVRWGNVRYVRDREEEVKASYISHAGVASWIAPLYSRMLPL